MKNLLSLITLTLVVLFTSCTKEALLETEIMIKEPKTHELNEVVDPVSIAEEESEEEYSTVTELEVSKVSYSQFAGELLIDFSSNFDFSSVVLETTQVLAFTDAAGNDSNISFTVNSYSFDGSVLSTAFAIGGTDLTGLELKMIQYIIIDDDLVD